MKLRALTPPVLLPDGREFMTWEPAEHNLPLRTLYVDCAHKAADDNNPGSQDRPVLTISRAARIAQPGD